jgi:hypothetical protein
VMQSALFRFKSVVPRGVQITAAILAGVALLAAFNWIYSSGVSNGRSNGASGFARLSTVEVMGFGAVAAVLVAAWLIALGFVYGDAKRRGMPAVLWTLMVLLTPNMIGFFLYFALRQPLLAECGNCGSGVASSQRFCSACGSPRGGAEWTPLAVGHGVGTPAAIVSPRQPGARLSLRSCSAGFAVWSGIFLAKSLFAFLKHDMLDAAVLFGFASIGFLLLIVAHRKPNGDR